MRDIASGAIKNQQTRGVARLDRRLGDAFRGQHVIEVGELHGATAYSTGVRFEVVATDPHSGLRAGVLHTAHGSVPTPTFMPVGTLGSVKSLTPADVRATGAGIVLSNTYHLALQPGIETVERLGGLHALTRWEGPMLTDSGGFQVFSLGGLRQISETGVTFVSHLDGRQVCLTPERVVDIQARLGADLIMPLDECVAASATRLETEIALARTVAWWRRCASAPIREYQALFALLQGGMFADLRREAVRAALSDNPPGFAIGGLSVGEPKSTTFELVEATVDALPADKPRYLMGIGHPLDLRTCARLGVDLFDCVLPTRMARNGAVWSDQAGTRLDLAKHALLQRAGPIAEDCACTTCRDWPLGVVAALFQAHEPLAYRLASVHNLTLLNRVLEDLRRAVLYTA
ncbi:MAG: tRNA guanosine(34) transglycosylase Tgt [Chloroflexi bacterium]|nr:tRNA guanosine(34) transglycosylase Tgt [Chloroflexota bacterium]